MKRKELHKYIDKCAKSSQGNIADMAAAAGFETIFCILQELKATDLVPDAVVSFITQTTGLRHGFELIDIGKLLYPQGLRLVPTIEDLLFNHAVYLGDKAEELLRLHPNALPETKSHWEMLINNRNKIKET